MGNCRKRAGTFCDCLLPVPSCLFLPVPSAYFRFLITTTTFVPTLGVSVVLAR